eukprot:689841_1
MAMEEVGVGDYIELSSHRCGKVKYIGEVDGKKGSFYGVELWKGDGKHSGTVNDVEYFECVNQGRGVFVTQKSILFKLDVPSGYDPFKQLAAKELMKRKKRQQRATKYSHLMTKKELNKYNNARIGNSNKKKKKKKTKHTSLIAMPKNHHRKPIDDCKLENNNDNKQIRTLSMEESHATKTAQEEQEKKDNIEKERLHKIQMEKERKEKLEREKKEKLRENALEQNQNQSLAQQQHTEEEDDKGFPKVHNAYTIYFEDNKVNCTNATHLVLFAKKKGLDGVGYSKVIQYFKAQKPN